MKQILFLVVLLMFGCAKRETVEKAREQKKAQVVKQNDMLDKYPKLKVYRIPNDKMSEFFNLLNLQPYIVSITDTFRHMH